MASRQSLLKQSLTSTQVKTPRHKPLNLADFAQASYSQKSMPGYFVDTEFTGPDRIVYHDGKHAIIVFKGTSHTRDVEVDAAMGLGFKEQTNRFRNSLDVTNRVISKYGKDNVLATGHSLGGSQAIYVHQKTGVKGSAYSPYIDPQDVKVRGKENFVGPNFHVHAIVGDPVAMGTSLHLLDAPNVHLYTPYSKYEKIASSIATSNPTMGINPFVKIGLMTAKAGVGAAGTVDLHAIGNFTSTGEYGDKVRNRDVAIPSKYWKTGPPQETFRAPTQHEALPPLSIGSYRAAPTAPPSSTVQHWTTA